MWSTFSSIFIHLIFMGIGWSLTIKGETWQNRFLRERIRNGSESKFTAEYANLRAFPLHTDRTRRGLLGSRESRGTRRAGAELLSPRGRVGPRLCRSSSGEGVWGAGIAWQHPPHPSVGPPEFKIFPKAPVPVARRASRLGRSPACIWTGGRRLLPPWLVCRGLPKRGLREWHI